MSFYKNNLSKKKIFTCDNEEINELFEKQQKLSVSYSRKLFVMCVAMFLLVMVSIALMQSVDFPGILCFLPIVAYIVLSLIFYSPIRKLKKEIKMKVKEYPEIKAKYKKFKRKNFIMSVIVIIVIIAVISFISSLGGSSSNSSSDEPWKELGVSEAEYMKGYYYIAEHGAKKVYVSTY